MAIKSILVSVDESPQFPALMETVWLIAERDGSYVEGLYLRPAMGALVAADGMSMAAQAALDDFEQEERIREQRLRGRFEDFFRAKQVPVGADAGPPAGSSAASRRTCRRTGPGWGFPHASSTARTGCPTRRRRSGTSGPPRIRWWSSNSAPPPCSRDSRYRRGKECWA